MTYYKALVNGTSCHGGDLVWSLPTQDDEGNWQPGGWHEVDPPIRVCDRGLHLTTDPMQWAKVGMQVFEAEGAGQFDADQDKTAFERARLLRPADDVIPAYWRKVEAFVRDEIPAVRWFSQCGDPDPAWRLFLGKSLSAARAAAGDAAGDAARDAALYAAMLVCDGLPLDERRRAHITARWEVWQRGYGLYGDVNGVLYVYGIKR